MFYAVTPSLFPCEPNVGITATFIFHDFLHYGPPNFGEICCLRNIITMLSWNCVAGYWLISVPVFNETAT